MNDAGIEMIADRVAARGIDAVIATNTTVSREGVGHLPVSRERGGLSGAPLKALATARGIPNVGVSETLQPDNVSFQDWQLKQLQELEVALKSTG